MTLSIIIPTLNEETLLPGLLDYLIDHSTDHCEIIVVDAGSNDRTTACCNRSRVRLIHSPVQCRAHQLNLGAIHASGEVFYFIHADAKPPGSFETDIYTALQDGFECGSYRLHIGESSSLLAINSLFTKFNFLMFQGGGDQSLFITRARFNELDGYNDHYVIMEDFDLVRRIRKHRIPRILFDKSINVSNRKYEVNNYFKVQLANLIAFTAFSLGTSPKFIKRFYQLALVKK